MTIRYSKTRIFTNDYIEYKPLFENRGLQYIRQFATNTLLYPTEEDIAEFKVDRYMWKIGDAMWRYAAQHYGRANLWWVIAHFNQKPTDHHFKVGDIVYIPSPLDRVFRSYGL